MNTEMNKDQDLLDETRVMERLTDETTVIDMAKIRNEQNTFFFLERSIYFFCGGIDCCELCGKTNTGKR